MKVIIAAAGTGGHINPGIAIANKIKHEEPDSEIIFIGTNRGLEKDLVPRAGYQLKTVDAYGLSKKISIENFKNILKTIHGIKQAKKIVKEMKPDIVIGTGGYICGSAILAAKKFKIPTMLHESNAFPGKAVKMLSKKVDTIMVSFEEAKKELPEANKIVVTGTPVKIKDCNLSRMQKNNILKELGLLEEKPLVLIFGGSQGAKAINDAVTTIINKKMNTNYQILWAAGPIQFDIIKKNIKEIGKLKEVKIVPYIYRMEEVMNVADLVVARSGAMTINELSTVGKPAIFIPLPYVSQNHQEHNARVLEKLNAAKIILNKELTANVLNEMITDLIKEPKLLQTMGENSRKIAVPKVEDKIYEEIKKLVKSK